MNLLEYQAKALLKQHGVRLPAQQLVTSASALPLLPFPQMLKVQIPIGGRGKAGGVKAVHSEQEFQRTAGDLLSRPILGFTATELLAEEQLDIARELYLSITIDRDQQAVRLLAHGQGGVEIESIAEDAGAMFSCELPSGEKASAQVPSKAVAVKLAAYYGLDDALASELHTLLHQLYQTFIQEDALLVEINPLVITTDGQLICADAKIELDDAARFRHQHWPAAQSQQLVILPPALSQAAQAPLIASMANGAGLAMATVDAIAAAGGQPANFMDVGGGTNSASMTQAFAEMARLPKIAGIVVNIFGGITRCDDVARAIIDARQRVPALPPLYIRLTGTNETAGQALLREQAIELYPSLAECVQQAVSHHV